MQTLVGRTVKEKKESLKKTNYLKEKVDTQLGVRMRTAIAGH